MLEVGAVLGAAHVLPRWLRALRHHEQPSRDAVPEPLALHAYDAGVDQAAVSTDEGATVVGRPTYSAPDAVHGVLGWLAPEGDGPHGLIYPIPDAAASSGSVYVTPHTLRAPAAIVIGLLNDDTTGSAVVGVRLRDDHLLDIVDGEVPLAVSHVEWAPEHTMRLDWKTESSRATTTTTTTAATATTAATGTVATTLTVWVYLDTNLEGWHADETVTAARPCESSQSCPPPSYVFVGSSAGDASIGFDSYRAYAGAVRPPPYVAVGRAGKMHARRRRKQPHGGDRRRQSRQGSWWEPDLLHGASAARSDEHSPAADPGRRGDGVPPAEPGGVGSAASLSLPRDDDTAVREAVCDDRVHGGHPTTADSLPSEISCDIAAW
jgi:hypothetical protein